MSVLQDTPLYLADVADLLGVTTRTVRNMVSRGDLPAYRLGGKGRLRFLRADVEALLVPVPTVTHERAVDGR